MSRAPSRRLLLALPLGLLGFFLYIGAVVALADHLAGAHWVLQALYFIAAGLLWVVPAHFLILWTAGK